MTESENAINGPQIKIFILCEEGKRAADLLKRSARVDLGSMTFIHLMDTTNESDLAACLSHTDMAFLIGHVDSQKRMQAATAVARICQHRNIRCLAIVSINNSQTADELRGLVDILNVIRGVPDTTQALVESVLNITDLLLGRGFVGIDFSDICWGLSLGRFAQCYTATASGADRQLRQLRKQSHRQ